MQNERFDIIFSTYGELENILGGVFAKKLFSCKFILDFRDGIDLPLRPIYERWMWKIIEKRALNTADAYTAISKGLAEKLQKRANHPIQVLYNGYEPVNNGDKSLTIIEFPIKSRIILRFCYTGSVYPEDDLTPLFHALQILCDRKILNIKEISFEYAGSQFANIYAQAKKYRMTDILVDYGYTSREFAESLQSISDFFVVARFNTKYLKGAISGKFFEGIRAKKPILSFISGGCPKSELWDINEQYNYGFCYEKACEKDHFPSLVKYLEDAIKAKRRGERINYNPTNSLFRDFRYDTISRNLERIMYRLIEGGSE